jgi:hypothetical protein
MIAIVNGKITLMTDVIDSSLLRYGNSDRANQNNRGVIDVMHFGHAKVTKNKVQPMSMLN